MNRSDRLLAEAQELLDQRRDPFDDSAFCQRLEECPDVLDEVVSLRAVSLHMSATRPAARSVPANTRPWAWIGLPAAAALLLWAMQSPPSPQDLGAPPSILAKADGVAIPLEPMQIPAAPAVLRFHSMVRTTSLNPVVVGDLLRVKITTSNQSFNPE